MENEEPALCFICKRPIGEKNPFYDKLCKNCGDLNYTKRVQFADLTNRVALVSGARVKIGFAVCLRMLRAGAKVIALTRFPHDAAMRYLKEPDHEKWYNHLDIYGLDFRDIGQVSQFIKNVLDRYPYLDILINNAAQTVRHPPAYFQHLLQLENQPVDQLPEKAQMLLAKNNQGTVSIPSNENSTIYPLSFNINAGKSKNPAMLSQVPLVDGDDAIVGGKTFPLNKLDKYGEQLDLRRKNSWVARLDEVSMPEILEVQLINQVVPTLFASQFKVLLEKSPLPDRYIVNVSSPEGQFSVRKEEGRHPHTCIAKAALDMLTFSIADDYAKSGIYVTSVDPGWVTQQFPLKGYHKYEFGIDINDAASRVCDPIFLGINEHMYLYGSFFKHYKKVRW